MTECEICETQFETRGEGQKYCSAKCKQVAYRRRLKAGRAVPIDAVAQLESLRRSRDYYRRKVQSLEVSLSVEKLATQLAHSRTPVEAFWPERLSVEDSLSPAEEDELQQLKRYVRTQERNEWRRPFCGLQRPGRKVPIGAKSAAEFTRELYEDLAVLRMKLNTASDTRIWEDLGYPNEDAWWSSVLDATADDDLWSRVEDDGEEDPEWMHAPADAAVPERPDQPPTVG